MKKVWAVSSGHYSYYSVLAIFATKAEAKAHAKEHDRIKEAGEYDKARVESFRFYDGTAPRDIIWYQTNVSLFITGRLDGDVEPSERHEYEYEEGMYRPKRLSARPQVKVTPFNDRSSPGHPYPPRFDVRVTGSDRDAVGKTTSEVIAQWRANGYRIPGYEIPPPYVPSASFPANGSS